MLETGIGADHEQIHEIGKTGLVLQPLGRDAAVEIDARRQITQHAAAHHEQPERILAVEIRHRQAEIGADGKTPPPPPRAR